MSSNELRSYEQVRGLLKEKGHTQFLYDIDFDIKWWNQREESQTCSFPTSGEDMDLKMEYVFHINQAHLIKNGMYVINFSERYFRKYGYEQPFRCEIVKREI